MAVCRVEKTKNYTVMSNYHLNDPRLSLKAIGLLSKILSLPEAWDYTVAGLAKICKEGRDAVRAALAELEEAGYILRRQTRDEMGNFSHSEYIIYETPQDPQEEAPDDGESAPSPSESAMSENPISENTAELNTKRIKYLSNIPPYSPPRGGRVCAKTEKGREEVP